MTLRYPVNPPSKRIRQARGRGSLPFVFVNVAISADGKIAPASRRFSPFTSQRDQQLLLTLRTRADAIMAGARTVDTSRVTLGNGGPRFRNLRIRNGLAPNPLRVLVSGSGTLNPDAEIFRHRFSPILLLTTRSASRAKLNRLSRLVDAIGMFGDEEVDFREALTWLRLKWKVKSLLCEGGGEVNGALFRANLVNELYVTISPRIFAGHCAPTLADGFGITPLKDACQLQVLSSRKHDNEMFLVYRVVR